MGSLLLSTLRTGPGFGFQRPGRLPAFFGSGSWQNPDVQWAAQSSLFFTHQPPPLWFSLFLCPPPNPLLTTTTTSTLPCSALLESKALYGALITTAAVVQPSTGAPQARPGPAPRFSDRLRSSSSVPTLRCHHMITSVPLIFPLPFFISTLTQTSVSVSCAHIPAGLHAWAVKRDTGEQRRVERSPCLKLVFSLMIYERHITATAAAAAIPPLLCPPGLWISEWQPWTTGGQLLWR